MKIGILQTGRSPDAIFDKHGDYPTLFMNMLSPHGLTFAVYEVDRMHFPQSPLECDGWLITGSRHGVYEDHDFLAPLEEFIRGCFEAEQPMVGICFGHQIIAKALGGHVEKFKDGWAIGRQEYDWGGKTVAINAWHQDQIVEPPKMAQVCASNDFCQNAVLLYGNKAFTIQAHPEFDHDFVEGLIVYRGTGVIEDNLLSKARENMAQPIDSIDIIAQMVHFFKHKELP